MSWQLPPPPIPNVPQSKYAQFYDFLQESRGKVAIPERFRDLPMYWLVGGPGIPYVLDGREVVLKTSANSNLRLSARVEKAVSLMNRFGMAICFDSSSRAASFARTIGTEEVSLGNLFDIASELGIGVGCITSAQHTKTQAFTIGPKDTRILAGKTPLEISREEIPAGNALTFSESDISVDRQQLFIETLEARSWVVPGTAKVAKCKLEDGREVESISFKIRPGSNESVVALEMDKLGQAFTSMFGDYFLLLPRGGGRGHGFGR